MASNLSNPGGSASAAASRAPIEALRFYNGARLLPAGAHGPEVAGTVLPLELMRLRKALLQIREDVTKPAASQGGSILAVFGGDPHE